MKAARHTILFPCVLTGGAHFFNRKGRAKRGAVLVGEFRRSECVILRAANGDLDRTHERGDSPRGLPVESAKDAVNQASAIGVAATSRVEHRARLDAGDVVRAAV